MSPGFSKFSLLSFLAIASLIILSSASIDRIYHHRCEYAKHKVQLLPVHPLKKYTEDPLMAQTIRIMQETTDNSTSSNSTQSDDTTSSNSSTNNETSLSNETDGSLSNETNGTSSSNETNDTSSSTESSSYNNTEELYNETTSNETNSDENLTNETSSDNSTNVTITENYTNSSIGPLRIFVDYSNCNVTSEVYASIKKLFKSMIVVINRYFQINRTITLLKFPYKYCTEAKVPKKHRTHGVRNADLILYITAENDPFSGAVAWASPCFVDDETDRPVAAQVNLNLYYIANETISTIGSTILHELLHVLGFDPDFFSSFIYQNGSKRSIDDIYKQSEPNNLIIIPELVEMARAYFNCQLMEGVPLEKGMGEGSDDSHWAEEFFEQELMGPVQGINQIISNFTLAFFKYTGWYDITYNNRSVMTWGKNNGCEWTQNECYGQTGLYGEFCSNLGGRGCTPDSRFLSVCWNSYSGTHCPMNYAARRCSKPNVKFNKTAYEYFGFIQHSGSKCFRTDISQTDFYDNYASSHNDAGFKCIEASCNVTEDGSQIIEVNFYNYTMQCNKSNVWISPSEESGYSGIFLCPDIKEFCEVFPQDCPKGCNGNGVCMNGTCECYDFIKGSECNYFGSKFTYNGTGLVNETTSFKPQYFS